jgi:hypothetical protein
MIGNPLVNLYRQDKNNVKKIKTTKSELDASLSPEYLARNNTSNDHHSKKSRVKTEYSMEKESPDIQKSVIQTEFSRRLNNDKKHNSFVMEHDGKNHVPTK